VGVVLERKLEPRLLELELLELELDGDKNLSFSSFQSFSAVFNFLLSSRNILIVLALVESA
jgi:hypothetical protein